MRSSMVEELTERLFAGDSRALVTHLLENHHTTETELADIRARIEAHEGSQED